MSSCPRFLELGGILDPPGQLKKFLVPGFCPRMERYRCGAHPAAPWKLLKGFHRVCCVAKIENLGAGTPVLWPELHMFVCFIYKKSMYLLFTINQRTFVVCCLLYLKQIFTLSSDICRQPKTALQVQDKHP